MQIRQQFGSVRIRIRNIVFLQSGVVDPNTMNLDPEPEFLSNLDPELGLFYQFWKKNLKLIFKKKNNFLKLKENYGNENFF